MCGCALFVSVFVQHNTCFLKAQQRVETLHLRFLSVLSRLFSVSAAAPAVWLFPTGALQGQGAPVPRGEDPPPGSAPVLHGEAGAHPEEGVDHPLERQRLLARTWRAPAVCNTPRSETGFLHRSPPRGRAAATAAAAADDDDAAAAAILVMRGEPIDGGGRGDGGTVFSNFPEF